MGAHRLRHRQRHRHSDDAVAAAALRPQELFSRVDRRLYARIGALRHGDLARSRLILFRVLQGAFGGGLLATAQVVLRDTFPPEQLGMSQSIFALGTIVGPSVGPTLGGILVDNFSWPWVFDVNVVPGIDRVLSLVALHARQRATAARAGRRRRRSRCWSWPSAACSTCSIRASTTTGSPTRRSSFARGSLPATTAASSGGSCASRSRSSTCASSRQPAVAAALAIAGAYAAIIFPSLLLLPQFTVDNLGFTSTHAGTAHRRRARCRFSLLTIPVARLAGMPRFDLRWAIGGGLAVCGFGSLWLAQTLNDGERAS